MVRAVSHKPLNSHQVVTPLGLCYAEHHVNRIKVKTFYVIAPPRRHQAWCNFSSVQPGDVTLPNYNRKSASAGARLQAQGSLTFLTNTFSSLDRQHYNSKTLTQEDPNPWLSMTPPVRSCRQTPFPPVKMHHLSLATYWKQQKGTTKMTPIC